MEPKRDFNKEYEDLLLQSKLEYPNMDSILTNFNDWSSRENQISPFFDLLNNQPNETSTNQIKL
jgi:hypothetical protein